MAAIARPAVPVKISVPMWAILLAFAALWIAFVVLQENGLMTSHWATIHEFFHDGRHALGFPCH